MRRITAGFILFCSAIFHAALRGAWPEMSDLEKDQCFCARELNQNEDLACLSHGPLQRYSCGDSYPNMVFGTVRAPDGKYQNVFLPSHHQARGLMKYLHAHVNVYLEQQKNVTHPPVDIKIVSGLYIMPHTAFSMTWPTLYAKIPFFPNLSGTPAKQDAIQNVFKESEALLECAPFECTKCCVVFNDVFDVGCTEFQLVAKIVDEVVPNMTQEQRAQFKIVLSAVYLANGRDEEVSVHFDGQDYPIGIVAFRGSVWDRLMMHAKLHVMDDYLSALESSSWVGWLKSWFVVPAKARILGLPEQERLCALRKIFDEDRGLAQMAQERYMSHVAPELIYEVCVNDFVEQKWINQEDADNMHIAMPVSSASCGLDLSPPLRYLFNHKGIEHFLEPIFYLSLEKVVLDEPAGHARFLKERTDCAHLHEAPLVTLQKNDDGHHDVKAGWLQLCQSRHEWEKGETIGVILLDPYAKEGCAPTREGSPDLLGDITAGMAKEVRSHGQNVAFFTLSYNGDFDDYPSQDESYPSAQRTGLSSCAFLHDTVRVVGAGDGITLLHSLGAYNCKSVRTSV